MDSCSALGRRAGGRTDGWENEAPVGRDLLGDCGWNGRGGSVFTAIIQRERGEKMISVPAFLVFDCGSSPKGSCPVARGVRAVLPSNPLLNNPLLQLHYFGSNRLM